MKILIALLMSIVMMAQPSVKPVDGLGNEQMIGPGGRRVIATMQTVPDSSTAIFTSTIKVVTLFCNNTTGTAASLTITDNQASPKTFFPAVSVAANSAMLLIAASGLTFTTGMKWSSGTTSALQCQVEGVQ